MNRLPIKLAFSILFTLGAAHTAQISAQTDAPARPAVGDCSREFLIAYFPPSLVEGALKKANIPQDKWANITKALTASEKDIITQVEEKASKITPNPLKDPQQRQVAVKIFRDTLYTIFSDVLKKNDITDDKQIQSMLDDIQQEKARKFTDCLEQHKIPTLKELQNQEEKARSPLADNAATAKPDRDAPEVSKNSPQNDHIQKQQPVQHDHNAYDHDNDHDHIHDYEDGDSSDDIHD